MTPADRARRLLEDQMFQVIGERPSAAASADQLAASLLADRRARERERREGEQLLEAFAKAAVLPPDELADSRDRLAAAAAARHPEAMDVVDARAAAAAHEALEGLLAGPGFDSALSAAWQLGLVTAADVAAWQRRQTSAPALRVSDVRDADAEREHDRARAAAARERNGFDRGRVLAVVAVPLVRVEGVCLTSAVLRAHAVELTVHAVLDTPPSPPVKPWPLDPELPDWLPTIGVGDDRGTDYGPLRGEGDRHARSASQSPLTLRRTTLHVRTPVPSDANALHLRVADEQLVAALRPSR